MKVYACDQLWRDGSFSPAFVGVDESGIIASVQTRAPADGTPERVAGWVVPGMPNLHSHAFQRAMAGLTEHASGSGDSFWTWRETMYGFLERLGPDEVEAIAAELYVEMLEAGYTAVGEFHYLHHAPDGRGYDNPVELAERVVAAAQTTGIRLTMLPVLYAASGFDGAPPLPGQRRFANDPAWLLDAIERLGKLPDLRVGIAPHSLRAVPPAQLAEAVAAVTRIDPTAPIHIHIAEQRAEVEACRQAYGARPVKWLLEHAPVDQRWCLVHATHVDDVEIDAIATSGAVVGLCPSTEANLGDGIVPGRLPHKARFGIGSDSHISVGVAEELRTLEYAQRLAAEERNLLADAKCPSVGSFLYAAALGGGAQALSQRVGNVVVGCKADLVVLDPDHPVLAGCPAERVIDAYVFSSHGNPVRDVMVGGQWVVRDGRHYQRDLVRKGYRRVLDLLR